MTQKTPSALLDTDTLALLRSKNLIINGDMRIDQRQGGASIACTAASVFAVDRVRSGMAGANGTAQRVASSIAGFPYMLQLTGAGGTTTAWVGQYIESVNSAPVVGKRMTVSFYAASSTVASLSVALKHANAADNFAALTAIETQTQAITSSLAYYSITFANVMPAGTANGLYIEIATGANLGTGTLQVTGLQLEAGTVATPFEYRHISQELAMCQRYFEKSGVANVGGVWAANNGESAGMAHPTGNFRMGVPFRVTKRAAPTFTTYDRTGAAGKCSYYVAGWTDGGTLPVASAIASGAYVGHNIASSVETQFAWTAEAEL